MAGDPIHAACMRSIRKVRPVGRVSFDVLLSVSMCPNMGNRMMPFVNRAKNAVIRCAAHLRRCLACLKCSKYAYASKVSLAKSNKNSLNVPKKCDENQKTPNGPNGPNGDHRSATSYQKWHHIATYRITTPIQLNAVRFRLLPTFTESIRLSADKNLKIGDLSAATARRPPCAMATGLKEPHTNRPRVRVGCTLMQYSWIFSYFCAVPHYRIALFRMHTETELF